MTATTKEYVDQHCMIGSANSAWVPCILEGGSPQTAFKVIEGVRNLGSTDYYLQYALPLPTERGGLSLYVTGVKVELYAADATDYLDMIKVLGLTYSGITSHYSSHTDYKSAQEVNVDFADKDCSSDDVVVVTLYVNSSSVDECQIRGVLLECFYD